jgi:hypothetical protein
VLELRRYAEARGWTITEYADELTAPGVSFVSLGEGLDTTTPAGRRRDVVSVALNAKCPSRWSRPS